MIVSYLDKTCFESIDVDHIKDEINGGIDGEHEVSNVDQILDMNIVWTSRSFRSRHPNSTNKLVDIGNNCETLTKHENCHHSF